ncbi:MAG: hypothetical protein HY225_00250 [Candidatus Vogelbacteria bacterium]|nr:hypothetical protein [Candidatus Vogelbacteria bacterium]
MYTIIRCGARYCCVILVTPANAGPDTQDAKYYRFADWEIGDHKSGVFNEITRNTALGYFSGMADGLGFEDCPRDPFPTLDVALKFVTEKRDELMRKLFLEIGIDPDSKDDEEDTK